jgi:hypothetical protein
MQRIPSHRTAGLLLAPLICLWSISAIAQPRIVVTAFESDSDHQLQDLITDELLFRNGYSLFEYSWFADEVDAFGATLDDFLADPYLLIDVCEAERIDAVVYGRLDRGRRARELTISVYEGLSGDILAEVVIELDNGEPVPDSLDWALADIESAIEMTEGSWEDEPPPPPPPLPPPPPPPVIPNDPGPGSEGQSLRVSGGVDFVQRSFTIAAVNGNNIQYASPFYPGIEGTLEIFPAHIFSPGSLDGLGLRFRLSRHFINTLLEGIDGTDPLQIPTRHNELGMSLFYEHDVDPLTLSFALSYETLAFVLGHNDVYQSSEYSGIAIAVGGAYAISPDLSAGLGLEVRPSPTLGAAEVEAFGAGDAFGIGVQVNGLWQIVEHVRANVAFEFLQYSNSFAGSGTSELTGILDATDTYTQLVGRLSYEF